MSGISDQAGEPLRGGSVRAENLVDHVSGSIVSKVVHRTAAGSVVVFAFDAGQELSEHATPCDALLLMLSGRAEVVVDRKTTEASGGDLVLLPARVPHGLRAIERCKVLLVMMRS